MLYCRSPVVLEQAIIVEILFAFMTVSRLMFCTGSLVVLKRLIAIEIDLARVAICSQMGAMVLVVRLSRIFIYEVSVATLTPSMQTAGGHMGYICSPVNEPSIALNAVHWRHDWDDWDGGSIKIGRMWYARASCLNGLEVRLRIYREDLLRKGCLIDVR